MSSKEVKALRAKAQEAYNLLLKAQRKYIRQEIQYKTIGASSAAIQSNAKRQELIKEALRLLIDYDNKLFLAVK